MKDCSSFKEKHKRAINKGEECDLEVNGETVGEIEIIKSKGKKEEKWGFPQINIDFDEELLYEIENWWGRGKWKPGKGEPLVSVNFRKRI